jgi:hypothetical protein
MDKVILFANDARGIYIPQHFAESISLDKCDLIGISQEDMDILKAGPDAEWYWETWDDVLSNGKVRVKENGQTFNLWQDGDLWLIDETAKAGVDHELWGNDD